MRSPDRNASALSVLIAGSALVNDNESVVSSDPPPDIYITSIKFPTSSLSSGWLEILLRFCSEAEHGLR